MQSTSLRRINIYVEWCSDWRYCTCMPAPPEKLSANAPKSPLQIYATARMQKRIRAAAKRDKVSLTQWVNEACEMRLVSGK